MIKLVFLWTDLFIYLLVIAICFTIFWSKRSEYWAESWRQVGKRKLGMAAFVILLAYSLVGLLDSIHFRQINLNSSDVGKRITLNVQSVLDVLLRPLGQNNEKTYSIPYAIYSSEKSLLDEKGIWKTTYPRLKFAGEYLKSPNEKTRDITVKSLVAVSTGLMLSTIFAAMTIFLLALKNRLRFRQQYAQILKGGRNLIAWREILLSCSFIIIVIIYIKLLSPNYHLLGTDKIGEDILYETIKSIRTGLVIGTLTTLVMLPFAVLLGTHAGYFGGWLDDVVQYVYTTLSSIPAVLLISAAVLSLEIFITSHPLYFSTLESRADARLLALCFILGITSWTTLCRLVRAEALKLKETDFVKAAITLGVGHTKIIFRHLIPNIFHIILITIVMDFSGLVLAEAVLSYVGVGVDPITPSWGNIINSARLDLSREPIVWWPLLSAFVFMFVLVLSANLFADAVRDAFDPRLRSDR